MENVGMKKQKTRGKEERIQYEGGMMEERSGKKHAQISYTHIYTDQAKAPQPLKKTSVVSEGGLCEKRKEDKATARGIHIGNADWPGRV